MSDRRSRRDAGFTLPEVVITVVITALIAGVLTSVFSVLVHTAPTAKARIDDARSLLGLSSWLPPDVASTSQTGFKVGDLPPPCAGSTNPGVGLLELSWSEGSDIYLANYRYTSTPDGNVITRFSCVNGGQARRLDLSGALDPILGAPPVEINLVSGGTGHVGLEFVVEIRDPVTGQVREFLNIDARTQNVPGTLPPVPTEETAPPPSGPATTAETTTTTAVPDTTIVGETTTTAPETTTTSSTTTTVAPCTASIVSVTPSTVDNNNGQSDRDKGRINSDITVVISKGETCGALVIAFDPDPSDSDVVQSVEEFKAALQVTIDKNSYEWKDGTIPLQLRDGSNGPVLSSWNVSVA